MFLHGFVLFELIEVAVDFFIVKEMDEIHVIFSRISRRYSIQDDNDSGKFLLLFGVDGIEIFNLIQPD